MDLFGPILLLVIIGIVLLFVVVVIFRSIRIVNQGFTGIVERLGKFHRVLGPGLNFLVPIVDNLAYKIDMREQVRTFPPLSVITEDNLVVGMDTVVYFQVNDPRSATYEIADYLGAVEQLTATTLRNVVGSMNLEEALTSRETINGQLRAVLDQATGKWGIKVTRVELKAIDPPASIQDSMEKQMRAERDRRAAILTAEGTKQSQILEAEGRRQSEILKAEGDAKAQVLRAKASAEAQVLLAKGESDAIERVFDAIHAGDADNKLLAYQYLQTLPKIAESPSSKLWIIPSEFTDSVQEIAKGFLQGPNPTPRERRKFDDDEADASVLDETFAPDTVTGVEVPSVAETLADSGVPVDGQAPAAPAQPSAPDESQQGAHAAPSTPQPSAPQPPSQPAPPTGQPGEPPYGYQPPAGGAPQGS